MLIRHASRKCLATKWVAVVLGFAFASMLMAASANAQESCFEVKALENFDLKKCAPTQVSIKQVKCDNKAEVIKDLGSRKALADCRFSAPRLNVWIDGQLVQSTLKEEKVGWGGGSGYVIDTTRVRGRAAKASAPQIAKPTEVVEKAATPKTESPKAEVAKAEPSKAEAAKVANEIVPAAAAEDLKFSFSGVAWIEAESTENFGYNGTSGITNFSKSATGSSQNSTSVFSNLQFDVKKNQTQLTSIFELGEVIGGDSNSGGAQGARQRVLEVRNFYLSHELNPNWGAKLGIQPITSDPNAFILSDHYSSGIVSQQGEWGNAQLWSATAFANRPGATGTTTGFTERDEYWGLQVNPEINTSISNSFYAVLRRNTESLYDSVTAATVSGRSQYYWIGDSLTYSHGNGFSAQATYIYNAGEFKATTPSVSDTYSAGLAALRLKQEWQSQNMEFQLDGIYTTGANDSVTTGQSVQTIGKRKSFASPNPGAAYLLTIATSDGADDAPGTAKESVVGSLAQAEGIQIYVFKVSKKFSDQFQVFARYGLLQSTASSAATGSRNLGQEWDLEAAYEISPGTTLQADFAQFLPGDFYSIKDNASLVSARMKFTF